MFEKIKGFFASVKEKLTPSEKTARIFSSITPFIPCVILTVAFIISMMGAKGYKPVHLTIMIVLLALSYAIPFFKFYKLKRTKTIVSAIFAAAAPFGMFYFVELFMRDPFIKGSMKVMKPHIVLLNVMFYYTAAFLITAITTRTDVGLTITAAVPAALGIANYFTMATRDLPVYPWDIISVKTALSVVDNYDITFSSTFYFSVFCLLSIVVLSFPLVLRIKFKRSKWLYFIPATCSVIIFATYISIINSIFITEANASKNGFYPYLFSASYLYKYNGTPVSFIYTLKFLELSPPAGYNVDDIKSLYEEYVAKAEADALNKENKTRPNIIVIMNEAFSDPAILGNFKTNEDYMPFIHSMIESNEIINGNVMVSVKGGNTPNSEFEFLTGTSMAFLPSGSIPYQQYIDGKTDTMVSHLNSLGYFTVGMHNYYATGWERDQRYVDFGFDKIYFNKDFTHKSYIRGYLSDKTMFKEIMLLQETKPKDEPLFVFGVTMQNHGDYPDSKNKTGTIFFPTIEVENNNYAYVNYLNNYLSLLRETDKAFEDLIDHFRNVDEPTVILMFGDHQPNDHVVYPILAANGINISTSSLEVQQTRYQTPYLLWANYELDNYEMPDTTSLNYLGGTFLDICGIPLTPFQIYQQDLIKKYPLLNGFCYVDAEETYHSIADVKSVKELNVYNRIQYNLIFDRKNTVKEFFYPVKPK